MNTSRRQFLQNSTQLAAGAGLTTLLPNEVTAASQSRLFSAADTVSVGLIGCNNMGWADLTSMLKNPGVRCIALCDVDQNVLNKRAADLAKLPSVQASGQKATLYSDFRKLLENKDIDAVIVGTPDHWHCLPTVYACQAGKDVYVEKPLANSIEECDLMVAAAHKYKRITQVGQWQRSGPHWKNAIDYARSGQIGTIRTVKTWAYMPYGKTFPVVANEPVPAGVDYDMWLGPAPKRPFNRNRFHGTFRYFWDYAGGLMTDWGAHMVDMALWGMQVSTPKSVVSVGGRYAFPNQDGETPDTMQVLYDYGNFTVSWDQSIGIGRGPYDRDHGVAFIGNLGTVVIDRGKWEVLPEVDAGKYLTSAMPTQYGDGKDLDRHTLNFVECIRSRQQTNCPVDIGRNVAVNAQLGNMAHRLGQKLFWDDAKSAVTSDPKANDLVKAHYNNTWKLPTV
ncbi:twin-arginine translocation signal domain-containing protein [Spirosoma sp. HMF4905]|uniref:Twin-arginine translocation signal domain-containing protein n=1 Tax=Spirosoma arboris TaxID=2682092 RepID=A0A7K1SAM4_9BACT|nr:Gfo/Idh/MocA family oxidoreductase [Spirosoma arboris]MVM30874.1 twin-arginine translocation signal domain-containing protein [Spirosoma arboris]